VPLCRRRCDSCYPPVVEPSPRVTIYLVVTAVVGFVSAGGSLRPRVHPAGKA
jgi:hypothetical protein